MGSLSLALRLPSLFWPSPPPSAARLRCPAFASGVAAPSQKTDRCPCCASAVSAAGSASAAQSRTRGSLPSQSRRPCGRLASSPAGRAKCTPVDKGKLCGKANLKSGSSCCMFTVKEAAFRLEPPRGARPQGAGGTSMGGGRDSIITMRGPALQPTPAEGPYLS